MTFLNSINANAIIQPIRFAPASQLAAITSGVRTRVLLSTVFLLVFARPMVSVVVHVSAPHVLRPHKRYMWR